ncbi:MAG: hypothetical protein K6E92_02100 [Lachnospiraceae bacterium]|nr:hypothetical protein [Lachnospiraceae bacterium]
MKLAKTVKNAALHTEEGIDGILVTIGLCIIALLLCVVMKDSLTTLITTVIQSMTTSAQDILTGANAGSSTTGGVILGLKYLQGIVL